MLCGIIVLSGCIASEQPDTLYESKTMEQGKWLGEFSTNLVAYNPGETVSFDLTLNEEVTDGSLLVYYKHLDTVVYEEEIELAGKQQMQWEWLPEDQDFTGYMVEVFLKNGKDVIDHTNIAVDVSSDWSKFPRYGYLADFYEIAEEDQQAVIDRLNRFHINGLQFYDWQDKHENPLPMENGEPASQWYDIANRIVKLETVETYINLAHEKNMKAMNYNLLFGASRHFEEEGVKREWSLFKDSIGEEQDVHPLPTAWKSDIFLFDPSNSSWQEFIFEKEQVVFDHLAFDGWHVDQLGDRSKVWNPETEQVEDSPLWNAEGEVVDLAKTYHPFLENAKEALQVDLVLNAVSQYGQEVIAKSPVSFLYTESWDQPLYEDLKEIIDENWEYSNGELQTVLAAYMNYDLANSLGEFNAPGVLLTDAVIFASGGAHIELGENMLAKEYFPNKSLKISDELNDQLIRYYDFAVAYQNLLRDGAEEIDKTVTSSSEISISNKAEQGSVWTFAKQKDNKDMIHFINFTDATSMEWKDRMGEQPEPEVKEDLSIVVQEEKEVAKVWVASPDAYHGSAMELDFAQKGDQLSLTMPSLKYWNMVVIEYK
jgi:dextranase